MPSPAPDLRSANGRVARFYDWFFWLYPVVECFCGPGRLRLVRRIGRLPPGRLLEIGVGPGRHLRHLSGHRVTAVDCSARMVALSRRLSPLADIRQMDGERLEFPDASFDYVLLSHVLSVTAHPGRMLAEAHRVLRPGGRLLVLNHVTPDGAWGHLDRALMPLARRLCYRSCFRLESIPGWERFHGKCLEFKGLFGLMRAYSWEK